jgi:hypothetical protein
MRILLCDLRSDLIQVIFNVNEWLDNKILQKIQQASNIYKIVANKHDYEKV